MAQASKVVNRVVAVGALRPHPRNYNVHGEAQIEDLRASLRRFGQVRSIVVQADGDNDFLVVAGEGIWEAAQREGFKKLRADVIPRDWDEAHVLAYMGADNELARQSDPDEAQLAALVVEVAEVDEELARLAAGAQERLWELELFIETEAMLDVTVNSKPIRRLGDRARQVKVVLSMEDLEIFEEAMQQTGNANRGEALAEICIAYLRDEEEGS